MVLYGLATFKAGFNIGSYWRITTSEANVKEDLQSPLDLRYTVFKDSDLECMTDTEYQIFETLSKKVNEHRSANNKRPLFGVFVNRDWGCFDDVAKILANYINEQEGNSNDKTR